MIMKARAAVRPKRVPMETTAPRSIMRRSRLSMRGMGNKKIQVPGAAIKKKKVGAVSRVVGRKVGVKSIRVKRDPSLPSMNQMRQPPAFVASQPMKVAAKRASPASSMKKAPSIKAVVSSSSVVVPGAPKSAPVTPAYSLDMFQAAQRAGFNVSARQHICAI